MSEGPAARSQDRSSTGQIRRGEQLPLRLARAISWIGHPLVFISLSVGVVIAFQMPNRTGLLILALLLSTVIIPMTLLLVRGVRSGKWRDADVSVRTERKSFYPKAIAISTISTIVLLLFRAPPFIVRGSLGVVALLVVAALVNLRIKLSLHALFAFFCTTVLFRVDLLFAGIALGLALLILWSRLYLRRHDLGEMLAGSLLGLVGGIAVTAWS